MSVHKPAELVVSFFDPSSEFSKQLNSMKLIHSQVPIFLRQFSNTFDFNRSSVTDCYRYVDVTIQSKYVVAPEIDILDKDELYQ